MTGALVNGAPVFYGACMCGRIAITLPTDAMAQLFAARPASDLPDVPNYNVCPTNKVHVVRLGELGRELTSMRWGFLPHWYKAENSGPLLINARAETLADKPAIFQLRHQTLPNKCCQTM